MPHGVTTYGKSSKAEDFAESLMLYHSGTVGSAKFKDGSRGPVLFRDLFPDRAKILDAMYPEVAERQKALVAERRRKVRS